MIGRKRNGSQCNLLPRRLIRDESGSVLLMTMIILLLLTLMGISGINTASTDLQITRNYRIQKQNLALADSAVNYAIGLLSYGGATIAGDAWVNDITDLWNADSKYFKVTVPPWGDGIVGGVTPVLNQIDITQLIADWDTIAQITPVTVPGTNTQLVVYTDPNSPDGNSVVIARSRNNDGNVIIEAGFNTN